MVTSLLEQVVSGQAPDIQRFTAQQYHQMIEAGIILDGAPIELIDGLLVRKCRADAGSTATSHGKTHIHGITRLQRLDRQLESFNCYLQTQLPIAVSDDHEPEPDGAVLRGGPDDYRDRLPTPADVVAVIEVADRSLNFDRTTKQRVYATAQIPTYWIINLRARTVEVYTNPDAQAGEYQLRRDFQVGETVELPISESQCLEIAVGDLLP